jgi:polysaccharide pyruvyl transferase WcaK-like protein
MAKAAIINDTGGTGHYGCDLVMYRLREELARAGISESWSHPVGQDWRPIADDLLQRPAVDVVIVNGEGSIHHAADRPRARYLPEFGQFARTRMGIPAYLINATIVDIDKDVANHLRMFDAIYVRDTGSQRELARFDIPSLVVADLTVGAELAVASERRGVCVTDSVVKEAAAQLQATAASNKWTTRRMHAKRKGLRVWESWFRPDPDFREFAQFLSSHELVVTGRFHCATMCIATRTPFIAVESNTPKISWLLDDVFGDRRRILAISDLARLDAAAFAEWSDTENRAIGKAKAGARDGTTAMFAEIARTCFPT